MSTSDKLSEITFFLNEKFLTYHQKMKILLVFCLWKTRKITKNSVFYNFSFFKLKIEELEDLGFSNIIIDPGFGFGKNIEDNYEILKKLNHFQTLEKPIMVGLSRKSMIYKVLNVSPQEALNGTTVLNTLALEKGANIIRVHDVKEAMECKKILARLH